MVTETSIAFFTSKLTTLFFRYSYKGDNRFHRTSVEAEGCNDRSDTWPGRIRSWSRYLELVLHSVFLSRGTLRDPLLHFQDFPFDGLASFFEGADSFLIRECNPPITPFIWFHMRGSLNGIRAEIPKVELLVIDELNLTFGMNEECRGHAVLAFVVMERFPVVMIFSERLLLIAENPSTTLLRMEVEALMAAASKSPRTSLAWTIMSSS